MPRRDGFARALVAFAFVSACVDRAEPGKQDDVRALRAVARLDDRTLALVREAENAAHSGHDDQAAARLEAARTAAVRAVEAADALAPRTPRGRAAQGELGGILERRKEAIGLYAEALIAKDDHLTLAALKVAREVETALVDWEENLNRE